MATYRTNPQHNGIEITFTSKPTAATLESLKASGYRWHRSGGYWYAKNTPERLALAEALAEGKQEEATETKTAPAARTNKFGVKVGDWFQMSWGYEQTNATFFQVVELVGSSSVRIREAYPEMVEESATSGMSADRTYKLTNEILPPRLRSVFINDQEKGDIKRLKSFAADGVSSPQISIAKYANAYYCGGDGCTQTMYESWYY